MVRVQVVGDSVLATEPLRRALARVRGVQLVAPSASARPTVVDTVVIDQSLGTANAPDGLREFAAMYPGASILVLALLAGDEYRWVHVEPLETAFHVVDAGTGQLTALLASSLGARRRGHQAWRHATVPAIPCSTA